MKWEYILIGLLLMIIVMVVTYLVGEKTWAIPKPSRKRLVAFSFYRNVNKLKRFKAKNYKEVIMLHLMKVSAEITNPTPDFNRAKQIFDGSTIFTLVDIKDDGIGHRYFRINTKDFGDLVFEAVEYMRVAYNLEIREREMNRITPGKTELIKELEAKPMLKIIKK